MYESQVSSFPPHLYLLLNHMDPIPPPLPTHLPHFLTLLDLPNISSSHYQPLLSTADLTPSLSSLSLSLLSSPLRTLSSSSDCVFVRLRYSPAPAGRGSWQEHMRLRDRTQTAGYYVCGEMIARSWTVLLSHDFVAGTDI